MAEGIFIFGKILLWKAVLEKKIKMKNGMSEWMAHDMSLYRTWYNHDR